MTPLFSPPPTDLEVNEQSGSHGLELEEYVTQSGRGRAGLHVRRFFTRPGQHPFDELSWGQRTVVVRIPRGGKKEEIVEFPESWSQNAVNIAASKYARGKLGTPAREKSLKQIVGRVSSTIRKWGQKLGYFATSADAETFEHELIHLLVHQKVAFNSPVWFNVGVVEKPQCSACFILSIEDTMESILEWVKTEAMIFKGGSGSGINLSPLRSSREPLSKGGYASGPVSFMRGADSVAGMIASGGATRRAAKMVVLNIDHPDVLDFIRCKTEEERKVRALMAAGFDMADLNNEAWKSIQYQNANNSVRVTEAFMRAVEDDAEWETRFVTSGDVADRYRARDLLREIAAAAWECGDPGMQFDTTVNDWNTVANTARINATNPCGEYNHIDDSACNLASLNLMKFVRDDGTFMVEALKHAVDVMILAMDIVVDGSSYPTPKITKNAHDFRELGLGYANLGALLMMKGLPYDSDEARALAAAITSLLCAEAYRYSAEIARAVGPFEGYAVNKDPMLRVLGKHQKAARGISALLVGDQPLVEASGAVWDEALVLGEEYGFRNSQTTVIAPTGTIALMMDCDTTGIEPDFSLVKMKQLVGGGSMRIVNQTALPALRRLGYPEAHIKEILSWIEEKGTIEGAPYTKEEHLAVFDCAVKPAHGTRSISWQGHVRMVAAVQPFISGAISKTFNMSHETTIEEIMDSYILAWKLGIKAFAVYRDGSKAAQPLQTSTGKGVSLPQPTLQLQAARRRLPPTRGSETHKFSIAGHEGYLTYGMYPDGTLAEIFIRIAKQGSTLAGLLDALALSVSLTLQYGVPLKDLARKFIYGRYEPAGFTENPDIPIATSITDYIFRYLALRFLTLDELKDIGIIPLQEVKQESKQTETPEGISAISAINGGSELLTPRHNPLSSPNGFTFAGTVCKSCGGMMIQTGSCMTCLQCGEASGGC